MAQINTANGSFLNNNKTLVEAVVLVNANGTPYIPSGGGGGGGAGSDRELVTLTYKVINSFTNAAVGDILTQSQVLDVTDVATHVSVVWRNQTTGVTLSSAPSSVNLELINSNSLTDAQLRATPVVVSPNVTRGLGNVDANTTRVTLASDGPAVTALTSIDSDLGAPVDAAAPADGTGNYSIIPALKRALLNGATILSRLPALVSGRIPTVDAAYDAVFGKMVVGNARGKVRDGFDTFDTVNLWEQVSTGAGDSLVIEGNATGASYLKIVKSPINTNTETILLSRKTFKLPVRLAIGASLSQRIAGQEFIFELVGVDANGNVVTDTADTPIAVTGVTTAATVHTFTTATPHGYVVGDTVQPYGFADSRFNLANVSNAVVTGVISPTQFTINGANVSNASAGAGFVLKVKASSNALEAAGYRWSGVTAANANPFTRSGSNSVYLGNEVAFGSTASTVPSGYNVANTYAHQPTTVFEILAQMESVTWAAQATDSVVAPTVFKRMQALPDIERDYKIRVRARNLPNLTVPVGKITNAVKTGTTTATLTIPNHGLTTSDQIVIYGIRDQATTSFPNVTTALAVTSVVDANNITVIQGTAGTATSAGGFVAKVQGGIVAFGAATQVVQSISRTSNFLTVVGNAAWSGISIGETVTLYGMDGGGAAYDGTYTVANVSTTNLVLISNGADFGTINCGGGVIKNSDLRLHFVRALDYTRHLTEVVGGLNRRDGSNGVPVVIQPNSDPLATTVNSGTITTVTTVSTVSALTGGSAAEDAAAGANPVIAGGVVRTAAAPATLVAGDAARHTMTTAGALTVATGAPVASAEVASAARTTTGNSGIISVPTGGAISGLIVVSAQSGTAPTLDITLEESYDNGTTWTQIWQAPRFAGATGNAIIPPMMVLGLRRWVWTIGGTTPSFTFAINTNQLSVVAPIIRQVYDRTAALVNGTGGTASASIPISGCKEVTAKILLSAATGPATYQIQVSDDNVNWSNVGTATVAVQNATTTIFMPVGITANFARVIVTVAATSQTGTYVAINAVN